MKKKTFNIALGVLFALLFLAEAVYSYSNTDLSEFSTGESLQIVHIPYDTDMASSNVISLVLEEAGFNTRVISVDNAIMYQSLASGESDFSTTAWLPVTHGSTYEAYEDSLVNLGPNLEGAQTSLAVPSYMEVDSIDELTDEANQTITGIEPGSGTTLSTEEAINTYDNLNDWTLETPSTGAMLASVESAVRDQEEIVVSAWSPHWMIEQYDLKFLDDPKGVCGEVESINTLTREGFQEDHPEAFEIIDRFYWTIEDMNSVTYDMEQGTDEITAAQTWIDNNRDKVDNWLEGTEE